MREWLRGEGGVIVCMAIYVVVSTHVICDRFQRAWKTTNYNQSILLTILMSGSHFDSLPFLYLQRHSNFDTPVTYVICRWFLKDL